MASIVSQLPPVTEPMMDKGGMMTLAWRRFFESQWERSGGFQDYIYAALLAANTGDAVLAEVASGVDVNASQIADLQAQLGGGLLESLQQETAELKKQISDIQASLAGNLSESLQEEVYDIRASIGQLYALIQSINGEDTPTQLTELELTLGTGAFTDTGTSGHKIPLLDGINTWSNTQTFTLAPVFTDQPGSRSALGLVIGTDVQAYDADLASIAAFSGTGAGGLIYRSASNTWSAVTIGGNLGFAVGTLGSSLGTAATQATGTSGATLPFANGTNTWANTQTFTVAPVFTAQANTRTALGLTIGTDVQAFDADLSSIASFAGTGTGGLIYRSAANTWSAVTVSANLGFAAGTLGSALGTAATQNTGTSGANVPLLNGANTWSADQVFGDSSSTDAAIYVNGPASTKKSLRLQDAGVTRWELATGVTNTFALRRYNSSGVGVDNPISVNPTSGLVQFVDNIAVGTYVATPGVITGYISIFDIGGTARKIAVTS